MVHAPGAQGAPAWPTPTTGRLEPRAIATAITRSSCSREPGVGIQTRAENRTWSARSSPTGAPAGGGPLAILSRPFSNAVAGPARSPASARGPCRRRAATDRPRDRLRDSHGADVVSGQGFSGQGAPTRTGDPLRGSWRALYAPPPTPRPGGDEL